MSTLSLPRNGAVKSLFITSLLLLQLLIFTPPVSATGGSINNFSGGFSEKPISLSGGSASMNIGVDSPRNVTFTQATFDIMYDSQDNSPGEVWLDVNEDGLREWSWNGTGMGDLGDQQVFTTGTSSSTAHLSANSTSSLGWYLPSLATLQTSDINLTFSADVGGFWQTGALFDLAATNVDSDPAVEVVFISPTPNGSSNSSTWIGVSEWDSVATDMTAPIWYETCENSTSLRFADVNNDSIMDIGTVDFNANMICLHLSNSTNGGFDPVSNISLPVDLVGVEMADMSGDGMADLVSAHASGDINMRTWDSATSTFSANVSQMVEGNGSLGMPATLTNLLVEEFYGIGNGYSAITFDNSGYATTWNWSASSWVNMVQHFDGMNRDLLVNDFNNDGYLDILGSTDFSTTLSLFNGTAWNTSDLGTMLITNATISDYNSDGFDDLLVPNPGTFDGQDNTIAGSISIRPINGTSFGNLSSTTLLPWTYPQTIVIADLDGDGLEEQIISAGESSRGFFAGAYHDVAMDLNSDGTDEVTISGYSGDGSAGVEPIYWRDTMNTVQQNIAPELAALASHNTSFGNSISHITPLLSSSGAGIVSLSDLQMKYDVTLTVDVNPYLSQNLTNVLNQNMQPGNSSLTFYISLPINSTKSGSLLAKNFIAEWIPGAPSISLPHPPTMSLYSLTSSSVELTWESPVDWGVSFVSFQVFRTTSGGTFDLLQPIQTSPVNFSIDTNVVIGMSYDYVVRVVLLYGVTSNFSSTVSVTIPYPSPPSPVQNVSVADVANDSGGNLLISWNASAESLSSFKIYVHSQNFSTVSNLGEVISVSSSVTSVSVSTFSSILDSTGNESTPSGNLQNGIQYWAAVVGSNTYGNQTNSVSPSGPAIPRNDTTLSSSLALNLTITNGIGEGGNIVTSSSLLSLIVSLDIEGTPAPLGADVSVKLSLGGQDLFFNGTTDVNGEWQPFNGITWDLINPTIIYSGEVTITTSFSGIIGDESTQTVGSSQNSQSFVSGMLASIQANPSTIAVDASGNAIINLNLVATSPSLQLLLDGQNIAWEAGNGSQVALVTGNSIVGNGGSAIANILIPGGGWFRATVDPLPNWLVLSGGGQADVTILPYSTGGGNENTSTPTEIIPLNLTCGSWELSNDASIIADELQCTILNSNSFSISLDWSTSSWVFPSELDINPSVLTIDLEAGASTNFELSSNILNDLSTPAGSLVIQLSTSTSAIGFSIPDLIYIYDLSITIIDDLDGQDVPNQNNTDNSSSGNSTIVVDDESSSNALIFIIGIVALIAIAGIVLVIIKSRPEDEDWDEDDLEYDDPQSNLSTPNDDLLPANRPLDEVKPKKRSKPKPIVVESISEEEVGEEDPFDISRKSDKWDTSTQYTESDDLVQENDEWNEEPPSEEQDEGISTDEDGTEWYEDEVGVWWYRTIEMKDWAEFEE